MEILKQFSESMVPTKIKELPRTVGIMLACNMLDINSNVSQALNLLITFNYDIFRGYLLSSHGFLRSPNSGSSRFVGYAPGPGFG